MISKGLPALKAYEELEPESPPDTNYFFYFKSDFTGNLFTVEFVNYKKERGKKKR